MKFYFQNTFISDPEHKYSALLDESPVFGTIKSLLKTLPKKNQTSFVYSKNHFKLLCFNSIASILLFTGNKLCLIVGIQILETIMVRIEQWHQPPRNMGVLPSLRDRSDNDYSQNLRCPDRLELSILRETLG